MDKMEGVRGCGWWVVGGARRGAQAPDILVPIGRPSPRVFVIFTYY